MRVNLKETITKNDLVFIGISILLIIGSFWFCNSFFSRAFPEASIDFVLTREDVQQRASEFLSRWTGLPSDYHQATIFDYDNKTKVFMERSLGLQAANRYFDREVKIWKWRTRWFKPLTKEEFIVDITPSGSIMGFQHEVSEDHPSSRLDQQDALELAELFLKTESLVDLSLLEPPEVKTEDRSQRTDFSFSWKRRDLTLANAPYYYRVGVIGSEIGGYSEGLVLPERWVRDYAGLVSLNDTTGTIAFVLSLLTFIGMITILVRQIIVRDIRWRVALCFGGIASILYFLNDLNELPLRFFYYTTTETLGGFFVGSLLQSVMFSLALGSIIIIIVAAGETLYRHDFPDMVGIGNLFRWSSIRTKKFLKDILLGYTLTGCFLAYQIVFYIVAESFGAWSPADIPYSNIVNTHFPWFAVLFVGFFPAVSEEFFNRAFCISFFKRLFRRPWLAVVIAAFLWGFSHATYPNQPFFIRGLEVGFAGVVMGFIFLRFGLLPLLVWHYTVDALYTALVFFRSSNPYFIVMALITTGILLIPLLVSIVSFLVKGYFETKSGLTNADLGSLSFTPQMRQRNRPLREQLEYSSLKIKNVLVYILVLTFLISGLLWICKDKEDVLDVPFQLNPELAQSKADYYLSQQGGTVSQYRCVASLEDNFVSRQNKSSPQSEDAPYFSQEQDDMALTYIMHHGGIQVYNEVLQDIPAKVWAVRYYQPMRKDEWRIYMTVNNGSLVRYIHLLPSDDGGEHLTPEEALARARKFLTTQGISLKDSTLVEQELKQREMRIDHLFTWEKEKPVVADARERIFVLLRGGQIGEYKKYIKIPEDWERKRVRQTVLFYIRLFVYMIAISLFTGSGLLLLYFSIRNNSLDWASLFKWALFPTIVVIIAEINRFPLSYTSYSTALSLKTHSIDTITASIITIIFHYITFVLFLAVIDARFQLNWVVSYQFKQKIFSRDAILVLPVTVLTGLFLLYFNKALRLLFPACSTIPPSSRATGLDLPFPFLESFDSIIFTGLEALVLVTLAQYMYTTVVKQKRYIPYALMGLSFALVPLERIGFMEYLTGVLLILVTLSTVLLLVIYILRNNPLSYVLTVMIIPIMHNGYLFLNLKNGFFQINGIILFTVGFLILLLPIKRFFDSR